MLFSTVSDLSLELGIPAARVRRAARRLGIEPARIGRTAILTDPEVERIREALAWERPRPRRTERATLAKIAS